MSKLAQIKTKPTATSVASFIDLIPNEQKRKDTYVILQLMEEAVGEAPKMWGTSIIGFGDKRYKSPKTGREVDWFKMGFSPRKANITLYLTLDMQQYSEALQGLGKHKTGVGCLYINKLLDVNMDVLKKLMATAAAKNAN